MYCVALHILAEIREKEEGVIGRHLKVVAKNTGCPVPGPHIIFVTPGKSTTFLYLSSFICVFLLHRLLSKLSIKMYVNHLEQFLAHSKHSVILTVVFVVPYEQYIHNKNEIKLSYIVTIITVIIDGERKMKHT